MKKILKEIKETPKICSKIVEECFAFLEGRECSEEFIKRVNHYLNQDPRMSKRQAVEEILDFEERELKNQN